MRKISTAFFVVVLAAFAQQAMAASATFSSSMRAPTADEIAGGVPAGATINEYFVNADADILSINQVVITPPSLTLYQETVVGDDVNAPNPALFGAFPELAADSFITTPGATAIAGGGFGVDNSSWFDSSNDGAPAPNFRFAQLTSADTGLFTGRISLAGSAGPENFSFNLPIGIPEPSTYVLAGMGLIGIVALRRRRVC